MDGNLWASRSCCGRTLFSNGSTFRIPGWKRCCTNLPRCSGSLAWTWVWLRRRTRTTVCRFRHLPEKHDLGGLMLEAVNVHLEAKGIRIATGTIVDATFIHAPSSTKNQSGERDPEMHQTRKGNQWYFGLKAHIGVDSKEGVVHSVGTSAASVADKHLLPDLCCTAKSARCLTSTSLSP
jgi:hypothetical protein